jgi:hypothetical protein
VTYALVLLICQLCGQGVVNDSTEPLLEFAGFVLWISFNCCAAFACEGIGIVLFVEMDCRVM